MQKKTVDIIGAGIGGLTTAIALKQKGFDVRIFEQAIKLKETGAGIILANNAMQIYDKLGCKSKIESKGNILSSMCITKDKLNLINRMDLKYFESLYAVKTIAIHRGELQDVLLDLLKDAEIYFGYKLINITYNSANNILEFENGISEYSDILIGADGLYSKVRNLLFPHTQLRYAKQVCYRGVTEFSLPKNYQNALFEAWGKTARFGFVKISQTRVYWYALKSFEHSMDEFKKSEIDRYFSNFHPIIKDIISSTNKNTIHTSEIIDLKPIPTWYQDNICLLGDAGHAMTPNMGQGACQAIEDGYILADCLSKYTINKAFFKYQKIRHTKVNKIVKMSWIVGQIAHIQNILGIKLRNFILSNTPVWVRNRQSKEIFNSKGVSK